MNPRRRLNFHAPVLGSFPLIDKRPSSILLPQNSTIPMKTPTTLWRFALASVASTLLAACAVSPNGPAGPGGSHGTQNSSLGSTSMSDYFYKKQAGWTYTFQNVEKIYNSDGSVAQTLTGSNDVVVCKGFDQMASNGDSLFRYEITYRVLAAYANGTQMTVNYVTATHSNQSHGAFVDPSSTVSGMITMQKRPRPVSTDTILAGIAGLIRTRANDFTNNGTYVWQTDTIWYSEHNDSAFIWEHAGINGPITQERCIFTRDFTTNGWASHWSYDVINEPNPQTTCTVNTSNMSMTVPATTSSNTVDIGFTTTELADYDFNYEDKYYGCYIGPVYQYDWWYVTTDGSTFTKQDFTRSLLSLTHN